MPPLTIILQDHHTASTTTATSPETPPPPPSRHPNNNSTIHSFSSSSSSLCSSTPVTLKFNDLCYSVKLHDHHPHNSLLHTLKSLLSSHSHSHSPATSSSTKPILTNITGAAYPGEILAVLGPSGSGKSTLLNALSGRLPFQSGTLLANGKPITARHVGFVPQDDVLYQNLTVRETLLFTALLRLPRQLGKSSPLTGSYPSWR